MRENGKPNGMPPSKLTTNPRLTPRRCSKPAKRPKLLAIRHNPLTRLPPKPPPPPSISRIRLSLNGTTLREPSLLPPKKTALPMLKLLEPTLDLFKLEPMP
jgi:hypothetical protein